MSRARNIKPGFFKNDQLAECSPLARLLFAGLWCEADREGRLADRPKRIKAECLPYDDCDLDGLLNQLASKGFIVRYVVEGNAYIAIPEFAKHQNPHCKESASSIPASDKHGASTVQDPEIPERARLIPDSLLLIPDTGNDGKPSGADAPAAAPARKRKSGAVTFTAWCDALPEGEQAIPEDHSVFPYADQAGIPREFVALAWDWFAVKYGPYGSGSAKTYTAWPRVFLDAVKAGWPNYWAFSQSGECYLTTAGKQAQRVAA